MFFSRKNFYHPAPKKVQRYCAALKGVGGLLSASTLAGTVVWLAGVGLALCILAETLEKLLADQESIALDVPKEDSPTLPTAS
jgi:hypothetical protein